jgi:dihydroorotate dehydrogenase
MFRFLHRFDSETIHDLFFTFYKLAPGLFHFMIRYLFPILKKNNPVSGIRLKWGNPIGLAAGLDKNAEALNFWELLGFGAVEIGTVTLKAQIGNPRPRIHRLLSQQSLLNYMGFPSKGVDYVEKQLKKYRGKICVGVNIGKNKNTPNEEAHTDYCELYRRLAPYAGYMVMNISSPNTPGLRQLQSFEYLNGLLDKMKQNCDLTISPLFLKIAPDLNSDELNELISLCEHYQLAGIVATNTTNQLSRRGGISGAMLREESTRVHDYLIEHSKGLDIIFAGGISQADQVRRLMEKGGKFFQIYSSFVLEGPEVINRLK